MPTSLRSLAALAALLVVLSSTAACSSDADDGAENGDDEPARVLQLGAPGESNRELTQEEFEALEAPTHTDGRRRLRAEHDPPPRAGTDDDRDGCRPAPAAPTCPSSRSGWTSPSVMRSTSSRPG